MKLTLWMTRIVIFGGGKITKWWKKRWIRRERRKKAAEEAERLRNEGAKVGEAAEDHASQKTGHAETAVPFVDDATLDSKKGGRWVYTSLFNAAVDPMPSVLAFSPQVSSSNANNDHDIHSPANSLQLDQFALASQGTGVRTYSYPACTLIHQLKLSGVRQSWIPFANLFAYALNRMAASQSLLWEGSHRIPYLTADKENC